MVINEIHWTVQSSYPILAGLQLLPIVAMILIQLAKNQRYLVPLAILLAALELFLAIALLNKFDPELQAMQFAERMELLPPLTYHAAVDGISVLFMLLTALLSLLVIIYAEVRDLRPRALLHTIVFALQTSLMSMFASVDLLWFTLASSIEVGLLGFLIARWIAVDWVRAVDPQGALLGIGRWAATGELQPVRVYRTLDDRAAG